MRGMPLGSVMLTLFLTMIPAHAATARWNASDGATGYRLFYGVASQDYDTILDVGPATSAVVEGLTVGETYYFNVTAYNTHGESDYSVEVPYTVPDPPPADVTPPTVTITAPLDGATVKRNSQVSIVVAAQDEGGMAHVEIFVGNALLCTDGTSPFGCTWRAPNKKGTSTLSAHATDVAGNRSPVSPVVTVLVR